MCEKKNGICIASECNHVADDERARCVDVRCVPVGTKACVGEALGGTECVLDEVAEKRRDPREQRLQDSVFLPGHCRSRECYDPCENLDDGEICGRGGRGRWWAFRNYCCL